MVDFKDGRSLADSKEVARDIAAMTLLGGVIAYGMEEVDEVASAAPGVSLAGMLNKIQQSADTNIAPPVGIDIRIIEKASSPGTGVIAVVVPASPNAPHLADDRFYARAGTTRRRLTELEIATLYDRRARLLAEQGTENLFRGDFYSPPYLHVTGLDMSDIGWMQLQVAPVVRPTVVEYRLARQLVQAVEAAKRISETKLSGDWASITNRLHDWGPFSYPGLVRWLGGREPRVPRKRFHPFGRLHLPRGLLVHRHMPAF